jgi:hypothetical protein
LEVLSYIKNYKQLLQLFSIRGEYLYLSLYITKNPIGFLKSIDKLIEQINLFYTIKNKIIYNDESIFVFAMSNQYKKVYKEAR